MTRSYGKTPRPRRQLPTAPTAEIQINITGRHTLEQLSLEVQRAIARLQDHGIAGVEKFRVRLLPLDEAAAPMAVWDDNGQQVLTINIPDLPPKVASSWHTTPKSLKEATGGICLAWLLTQPDTLGVHLRPCAQVGPVLLPLLIGCFRERKPYPSLFCDERINADKSLMRFPETDVSESASSYPRSEARLYSAA